MTKLINVKHFIPDDVIFLSKLLNKYNFESYIVGGCIRDIILEMTPNDWDICTNANPDEIIEICNKSNLKYLPTGIAFGTVTVMLNDDKYEITTYREDCGYSDGRHPDKINLASDIHTDLSRRDFTINALAYNPITEELIDDFNGVDDLNNKVLRCIGNPEDRFNEDSLRVLRALRFAVKYQLKIADETSKYMHEQASSLSRVSKERITTELRKTLTCNKTVLKYFLEYSDIITEIIPELKPCVNFNQNNKYHLHDVYEHILYVVDLCDTNKFTIKLAALLHDIAKPITYKVGDDGYGHFYEHPDVGYQISIDVIKNDLRITKEEEERVLGLVKYHDITVANTKASMKRALNKHGEGFMQDWFILKQADSDDHVFPDNKTKWKFMNNIPALRELMHNILEEQSCFSLKDLYINGTDLMELLQVKPSKCIGEILNTLLQEVIDEKIENNKLKLSQRALELFREM